jgi:hypothetical protein
MINEAIIVHIISLLNKGDSNAHIYTENSEDFDCLVWLAEKFTNESNLLAKGAQIASAVQFKHFNGRCVNFVMRPLNSLASYYLNSLASETHIGIISADRFLYIVDSSRKGSELKAMAHGLRQCGLKTYTYADAAMYVLAPSYKLKSAQYY